MALLAGLLFGCAAKQVTPQEAEQAIRGCGMSPDKVFWKVLKDGSLAFGQKSPNDAAVPFAKVDCLTRWADKNRVNLGFIGWEQ
jgi:hypothetical protein